MKTVARLFKLFSDETRIRILMLLMKRELCVCQLMAVLGISQPLVSRNLSLLSAAGLLGERREGKLVFYSLRKGLPAASQRALDVLKSCLKGDRTVEQDIESLTECTEFQKMTGRCDMETFLEFMRKKKSRKHDAAMRVYRGKG